MQNQPQIIYVPVYPQQAPVGQPTFVYPNGMQAPAPTFVFPESVPEQSIPPASAPQFVEVTYPVQSSAPKKIEMETFDEELQNVDFTTDECCHQRVSIRSWLKRGWRLYRQDWLAYSTFQAIIFLATFIAYFGQYYFMFEQSPLWMVFVGIHLFVWPLHFGHFIAGSHIVRQADGSRGLNTCHFYKGFKLYFPLLAIIMIVELIVSTGFLFFILPGLYFGVTLCFAPLVYIEYHHDTNPLLSVGIFGAIGHSYKIVHRYFWKVLGFIILCAIMNVAAMYLFFVGLLVTMPVTMLAVVFAFRDLFLLHPDKVPDTHCYCCC